MKKTLCLIMGLMIIGCSSQICQADGYKVEHKGALRNMMHKGDISAKISLSELKDKPNLYALGAVENLKGEIQVFDGEPLIAFASDGKLSFDSSFDKKATLLVYTQVPEWKELTIPNTITSYEQLETFIRESAEKNGLDVEEPFPFLISGKAKSLDWHVIDWKEGDTEHTHKKHIESGPH